MSKDIQILFIPDVHGRDFWREPVQTTLKENPDAKIVFLGDYVDPYPHEFEKDFNYYEYAVDVLCDVLKLKEQYPNRITLLIGNHDCGYAISQDICRSRRDYLHAPEISEIFKEYWNDFQLVYETHINDIHYVLSHAGISMDYIHTYVDENMNKEHVIDYLNNMWETKHNLDVLGVYDRYRGGLGAKWASPIWADIRQMIELTEENTIGDFQIVGHTQLGEDGKTIISQYIGDFDSRQCFYIDSKGLIHNYLTDDVVYEKK